MKNSLISAAVLVMLFVSTNLAAQSIIRQSIGTTGGANLHSNLYLAHCIGQPYHTLPNFSVMRYTPGFIQPQQIALIKEVNHFTFKVYPNPASNQIHITTSDDMSGMQVAIRTIQGQLVYHRQVGEEHLLAIDCSDWTKGTYFVTLMDSSNKPYTTKLIIYN